MPSSALTLPRRRFLEKVRRLVLTNPFSRERALLDAELLNEPPPAGGGAPGWVPPEKERHASARIAVLARRELEAIPEAERRAILSGSGEDALLVRDSICFLLFYEFCEAIDGFIERTNAEPAAHRDPVSFHAGFERELSRWFRIVDSPAESPPEGNFEVPREWAARVFAVCYQLRRAYNLIHLHIIGSSRAMTRLREAVWAAVFTRNLEWYWRFLAGRMEDFATLVTGPTGSGKEAAAQAICRSQYIPFNPKTRRFECDDRALFLPVNLAALSGSIIESELFGHVKGAFTGAVEDREGLMTICSPHGAIFLDEIGELGPETQVKLLRVLQTRTLYPLGGRKPRRFEGRVVSATHQDVERLVREGRIREDFYYRLAACRIRTPSLRERFDEEPEEIPQLTAFLLRRILGTEHAELEEAMTTAVTSATRAGRPWRGNVRELEQFLRQRLAGDPAQEPPAGPPAGGEGWTERMLRGELTIDELMRRYCKIARERHGGWESAGRALEADWRTIKKWAEK